MNKSARLAASVGALLAALSAFGQTTPAVKTAYSPDKVKVGDADVPIPWPAAINYQKELSQGGKSYPYVFPARVATATDIPGGYPALHAAFDQIKSKLAGAKVYRILVAEQPAGMLFDETKAFGIHTFLTHQYRAQIPSSLALFAALLETESGGAIRVEFNVFEDSSDWVRTLGDSTAPDATSLYASARAEHDSPAGRGYDCVFHLVSSQAVADLRLSQANGIPMIQAPIMGPYGTSDPNGLAESLWWAWHGEDTRNEYLQPNPSEKPATFNDWLNLRTAKLSTTDELISDGAITKQTAAADSYGAPQGLTGDKTLDQYAAYGDYTSNPQPTGDFVVIRKASWITRGGVRLANLAGTPASSMVTIKLKAAKPSDWAIVFASGDGKQTFAYDLSNYHLMTEANESYVDLAADNQWHELSLEIPKFGDQPAATVELQMSPRSMTLMHRESAEAIISFAPPVVEALEAKKLTPYFAFAPATGLSASPSPAQILTPAAELASKIDEDRVRGLTALAAKPDPTKIPDIALAGHDGNPAVAYAACEALAASNTPDAQAALKKIVIDGPFDTNRASALKFMERAKVPVTSKDLWRALAAQDWTVRLAAVRVLANATDENRNIVMLTMMQDGEPAVRATVPRYIDPDDQIGSKRLLFFGANDPCELVRINCITHMLTAKNTRIRAEAYRAVREDSPWVATKVLSNMDEVWVPDYAEAVKLAILDARPTVAAAALAVMARQEGDFQPVDAEPKLNSTDYQVEAALVLLAEKKKGFVPAATLQRISQSGFPDLTARLQKLNVGS